MQNRFLLGRGINETTFIKNTLKQKKNLIEREILAGFHFSVIEKNLFNDNENSYFFSFN